MIILVVDDNPEALAELTENLQTVFIQETISAFSEPLFALQYAANHPKEIGLVFSAMAMRRVDGLDLAKCLKKSSPGAAIFFTVQTKSWELAAIAKQHGNGTCLTRPVTVEAIREAASFLEEPCPWEGKSCEERCLWEWCEHKKLSVKKTQKML